MRRDTIRLFGIEIDRLTMDQAVGRVRRWLDERRSCCRYIVTPNLDHIVRLRSDTKFSLAYRDAALVVADGWPIVTSSWLLGRPLPERVAGSDLVPRLFDLGQLRPLSVFLLGGMPGVPERAAERITRRWPGIRVCGVYSPPWGFEHDREENDRIVNRINAVEPDLLVVGLGAPKQEVWLSEHYARLRCKVAVAAGATIDFLAGEQKRAPRWMQQCRLEWFYRLVRDPKRLAKRYWHDAVSFPTIFWSEWKIQHTQGRHSAGL